MDWRSVVRRAKAATAEADVTTVVRHAVSEPENLFGIKWRMAMLDLLVGSSVPPIKKRVVEIVL